MEPETQDTLNAIQTAYYRMPTTGRARTNNNNTQNGTKTPLRSITEGPGVSDGGHSVMLGAISISDCN